MTAGFFWSIQQKFLDLAQSCPKFGAVLAQAAYDGSKYS
jgi:hypothetical protein